MFKPLTRAEIRDIVTLQFKGVEKMLAKNNIQISFSNRAADRLAEIGFDPQFGARPLKRVIQREVLNELSKMILAGKLNSSEHILVDTLEDGLVFKNS
jgi:ATP-dependent Clp protease ATP-binding subunit ClpB